MITRKIIFLTYAGIPLKNSGGGNRIVYELMNGLTMPASELIYINSKSVIIRSIQDQTTKHLLFKEKESSSKLLQRYTNSYFLTRIKILVKKIKLNCTFSRLGKIDLLNSHDSIMLSLVKYRGVKKILSIHHKKSLIYDLENNSLGINYSKRLLNYMRNLEIDSIRKADLVIFVSESSRLNYLTEYPELFENKKTKIIYNGIDNSAIKSINQYENKITYNHFNPNSDFKIINIANHIKAKNINVLINVVETIKNKYHKNPILLNVGYGPLTNDLLYLIEQKDLKDNIKFLGQIPNDEVIALLKWAKYFLMASEKVVFDLVVLEALAAGSIVIVHNDGGNREIIADGVNGYLFNTFDPITIAEILINAKETVIPYAQKTADQFDISFMLKNYETLFNNTLNNVEDK
jgi:glycosyltransferase involved in cell wall biosynthesis